MAAALLLASCSSAYAHHPTARCRYLDADTIQCQGGFTDGGGAQGVVLDVIAYDERILVSGKLGKDSTMTFKKPSDEFYILMDAGPGHVVEIDHSEVDQ